MSILNKFKEYLQCIDFVRRLGAQCKPPVELNITINDTKARAQLARLGVSLDQFREAMEQYHFTGVYSDPAISNWSHVINLSK